MTTIKSTAFSTLALLAFSTLLYPVQSFAQHCDSDQWLSRRHGIYFDKYGRCSQYNYTDSETCQSAQDKLRCDWDSESMVCYPERGRCSPTAWYSRPYNRCFDKQGCCDQYDYTDERTCNTGRDDLRCDWEARTGLCRPEQERECEQGEWYSDKYDRCFNKNGPCHQYGKTDVETCNNDEDHVVCRWNPVRSTCLPKN